MIIPILFSLLMTNTTWSKETGLGLVCVTDGSGVAIQRSKTEVAILDSDGKVVKVAHVKDGFTPIRYTLREGLVTSSKQLFTSEMPNDFDGYMSTAFGQNRSLIRAGGGLIVVTQKGPYARDGFDNYSGVAVNRDGDMIVLSERPMNVPILRIFSYVKGTWIEDRELITPEIEGVGLAVMVPRFNDILFADASRVVFIGGLLPMNESSSRRNTTLDILPRDEQIPLDDGPRLGRGYIFSVNLKARETRGLAMVGIDSSGESGSYRVGRLASSADGKWLYVLSTKGTARLPLAGASSQL